MACCSPSSYSSKLPRPCAALIQSFSCLFCSSTYLFACSFGACWSTNSFGPAVFHSFVHPFMRMHTFFHPMHAFVHDIQEICCDPCNSPENRCLCATTGQCYFSLADMHTRVHSSLHVPLTHFFISKIAILASTNAMQRGVDSQHVDVSSFVDPVIAGS